MEKVTVAQLLIICLCSLLISFFMFWKVPLISWFSLIISVLSHAFLYFYLQHIASPTKSTGDNANGCTINWKIENLTNCCFKKGKSIKSPIFTVDSLNGTKWSLYFYPKGVGKSNLIYAFLQRENDYYLPNVIQVKYHFSFFDKDGKLLEDKPIYEESFERCNCGFFISLYNQKEMSNSEGKSFISPDNLTIQCKIWKLDDETPVASEILSARTVFKVQQRSFLWKINKYSNIRQVVVKKWTSRAIDLRFVLRKSPESEKSLVIDISSVDTDVYYFSFKASIVDSGGEKRDCGSNEYSDGELQNGILYPLPFTHSMLINKKSLYLPKDVLTLDCEYVYSSVISSYECTKCGILSGSEMRESSKNRKKLDVEKKGHRLESALMEDLKSMHIDAILYDVQLRTSTQVFPAHRAMLSARSAVFKSMFSSEMKEKNSGHVDVTDLDDETVRRMLKYIYTDSLGDLQMASAYKLYAAADKYDISSLKRRCSAILKENLCPGAACDILALADLHQDDDLKCAVHNYIIENDKKVFDTQEWKDFMATNLQLAADVMYQKVSQNRV